jgi:small subunit ribosomal protein S20
MPNTKTAKKALRQNIRRKIKNLADKRKVKTAIKTYKQLVEGGDLEGAKQNLTLAYKALDKAAKTKIITKNKASRLKSKLARKLTGVESRS